MPGKPNPSGVHPRPGYARAWVVAALTAALFSRVLTCDFVDYDDGDYVTANEQVQKGLDWPAVRWAFTTGHASNWHPLTWLSHMTDVQLYGLRPAGHHATSMILHAVNAGLVFALLLRWIGHPGAAFVGALAFAWHPLRVESVAWVSERKDVLSLFFGLLTLWAYTSFVRANDPYRRWTAYGAAWLSYAAGLMSKPMLVSLPFVMLLLDAWPLRRTAGMAGAANPQSSVSGALGSGTGLVPWRVWARLVLEKLPFFLLAAISCVVTYRVQQAGGAVAPVDALPWDARWANVPVSYARYLLKTLWPLDLAVLYPHPGYWSVATVLACTVFIAGLVVWTWLRRREAPYLWVGGCWFFGTLVPVIGLVQVGIQSMADRYTYFPSVGLGLALAGAWARWFQRSERRGLWIRAAVGLILAIWAGLTWRQIGFWRTSETLFRRTLAVTRDNYLAHNNLGFYLVRQGRWDEAMEQYRAALAIRRDYFDALNNLGHALAESGRPAEAIPWLEAALRLRPTHVGALNNYGNALAAVGRWQEAMAVYRRALAVDPRYADTHNNLGVALGMQGRLEEALPYLQEAIRLRPRHGPSYNNLGNALAAMGRWAEAEQAFRQALALDPHDPQACNNLGNVLLETGRWEEAEQAYGRALALQPRNPETHFNLAQLHLRRGRVALARQHLMEALRLRPDYPEARAQLERLPEASGESAPTNPTPVR
ncbi:tetratricopeptide repeat protein [Limisphaera sp. VF-2]|jgi:tetratricopeptide (TPR) repeat protein|uniref:tetratricopeptide repeat protein n=1 Tax=Limisphaera sp. VF-2 TaxID=3400418 RepID=UPI003C1EC1E6